jgi:hypothetical protein
MERVPRKDISPRYYLIIALRYMFAIGLSSLFFLISQSDLVVTTASDVGISGGNDQSIRLGILAAISFTIGMFPNIFFRKLWSIVGSRFGTSRCRDIPLENLTGVSTGEATRLWEEGISNIDQLADSSVEDLYRKTRICPAHLQGLVGRALLWKHVFGIERMIKMNEREADHSKPSDRDKRLFRFPDIQSLCSYMFGRTLDTIENENITKILSDGAQFKTWEKRLEVPEEILRQVAVRAPYFKKRLGFIIIEEEIGSLLAEELEAERKMQWR